MKNNKTWKRFSSETIHCLFTAIDNDDLVDADVSLPQLIDLQCSEENILDNYALCLQYWKEGFTRDELLSLIHKVVDGGRLTDEERMRYKYIRARYKHLRFAQRLYSKKHTSRSIFTKTTVFLGQFQDAFRNENRQAIRFYGRLLNFYLSWPVWMWVNYSLDHTHLDSVSDFISYRQGQMRIIEALVAKPSLTGKEFHIVRKIISQQVSYYDTLRTIDQDNREARQMSRYLAAINGLMGDRHDVMVADNMSGRKCYDQPIPLDEDIRQRLELLLERFPLNEYLS